MEKTEYSPQDAAIKALDWCARNQDWMRICDIPDSEAYTVNWNDLSLSSQKIWQTEDNYREFAVKKSKVETGFISGRGDFYKRITDVPPGHNLMMVFKVGHQSAREIQAKKRGVLLPVPA